MKLNLTYQDDQPLPLINSQVYLSRFDIGHLARIDAVCERVEPTAPTFCRWLSDAIQAEYERRTAVLDEADDVPGPQPLAIPCAWSHLELGEALTAIAFVQHMIGRYAWLDALAYAVAHAFNAKSR